MTPSKRQRYTNVGYPLGSAGKLGHFLILLSENGAVGWVTISDELLI